MTAMSPLEIPSDTAFAGALMGLADVSLEERREEVLRNFDEIRQRLRPLRQGLSEAKASLDHFAANGITGSDDELDEAIANGCITNRFGRLFLDQQDRDRLVKLIVRTGDAVGHKVIQTCLGLGEALA